MNMNYLLLIYPVIFVCVLYVIGNYTKIRAMDSGTEEMIALSNTIRDGANAFIQTEYMRIVIVVALVAGTISLFLDTTCGLTFIIGALMSSAGCVIGMSSAAYANVKTTNVARTTLSVGKTVNVALVGGSIPGLSVQSFGILGLLIIIFGFGGIDLVSKSNGILFSLGGNASITRLTTYSLGCSIVAMFNRVAGGNYTKAADISSDILAKLRHDLPEDDSRVPNVIADFIGDLVNDIAGNCSDLLESFVATIVAVLMIAMTMFASKSAEEVTEATFQATILFPIFVAGGGLLGSFASLFFVSKKELGEEPAKDLDFATNLSAFLTILVSFGCSYFLFYDKPLYPEFIGGWLSPWFAAVLGILSGVIIGKMTEHYTAPDKKPTRRLAEIAPEGTAFVITKGDALGARSAFPPIAVISFTIIISGFTAGIYGTAMAALGMLSFVGATVSIDAFGPIADNAGGIAESCHLDPEVRRITDKLDAVGNTTAAIGKGFAIGSAALATVSLIIAYISNFTNGLTEITISFAEIPILISGMTLGAGLISYFSAMLGDNTIDAAKIMADVGDEMMTPEVISGEQTPDYNRCVKQAAEEALKRMLTPSILALIVPIFCGLIFGILFVGGLLIGATIFAVREALFNGNSGGAFDNAKKIIESGELEGYGKGSPAHKSAVNGDTVGDTRKDVIGVALDIFIKMMSTVANTLAPLFARFSILG